ncbi:MAG: hypothetical protein ABEJ56_00085 [Candidatus Nanohaloarchaea archaeon]
MTAETVSQDVLNQFKDFFNELEFRTFVALHNYYVARGEWPTWREVADFMDEKPENIQPRISNLRDRHAVITAGKRPCKKSNHNRAVNTFKPVMHL